jgi:adenosylmethionine-8-amino-7-oxononanoate aminotransferase
VCGGDVYETIARSGFTHGFTYSHSVVGAAAGRAVLEVLRAENLAEASRTKGELLRKELATALGDHPNTGDVRGLGLMVGVELVADIASKRPFPRTDAVAERVVAAAKERGLLLYSSTGCADGTDGDLIMFGPPFVITEEEIDEAVAITSAALAATLPA